MGLFRPVEGVLKMEMGERGVLGSGPGWERAGDVTGLRAGDGTRLGAGAPSLSRIAWSMDLVASP